MISLFASSPMIHQGPRVQASHVDPQNQSSLHLRSAFSPLSASCFTSPPPASPLHLLRVDLGPGLRLGLSLLLRLRLRLGLLRRLVLPDPGHAVSTTTGQMGTLSREVDTDHTVLVPLEHELRLSSLYRPELDRAVFGPGNDPLPIGGDGHGEDVVLGVGRQRQRPSRPAKCVVCKGDV
jgi:hypothetical protein